MKTEILFGYHPVREAIRAGRRPITELYAARKQDRRLAGLLKLAETFDIRIMSASFKELTRMAGTERHQGVCLKTGPYPLVRLADLTAGDRGSYSCILMLDSIQDVHNLGAMLRTALCAGFRGVVLPKDRSASPNPVMSKASAGAMEHIPIAVETNLVNALNALKPQHYWIIGLDGASPQSVFDADCPDRTVMVIGGEEKGIRPLVKKNCDLLVSIPQSGPVDSLNASVAAGIAMYAMYRKHGIQNKGKGEGIDIWKRN